MPALVPMGGQGDGPGVDARQDAPRSGHGPRTVPVLWQASPRPGRSRFPQPPCPGSTPRSRCRVHAIPRSLAWIQPTSRSPRCPARVSATCSSGSTNGSLTLMISRRQSVPRGEPETSAGRCAFRRISASPGSTRCRRRGRALSPFRGCQGYNAPGVSARGDRLTDERPASPAGWSWFPFRSASGHGRPWIWTAAGQAFSPGWRQS